MSSLLVDLCSQCSQLKRFSPVCILSWVFRFALMLKVLLQILQMKSLLLACIFTIYLFKSDCSLNYVDFKVSKNKLNIFKSKSLVVKFSGFCCYALSESDLVYVKMTSEKSQS